MKKFLFILFLFPSLLYAETLEFTLTSMVVKQNNQTVKGPMYVTGRITICDNNIILYTDFTNSIDMMNRIIYVYPAVYKPEGSYLQISAIDRNGDRCEYYIVSKNNQLYITIDLGTNTIITYSAIQG